VLNNFASRLAELGGRTRGYATRSSSVPATSGRARSRSATLLEQAIRVRATSGSHDWTAPAGGFDRDPPVPHHVLRDDMTLASDTVDPDAAVDDLVGRTAFFAARSE
jgi:hypothetical protein